MFEPFSERCRFLKKHTPLICNSCMWSRGDINLINSSFLFSTNISLQPNMIQALDISNNLSFKYQRYAQVAQILGLVDVKLWPRLNFFYQFYNSPKSKKVFIVWLILRIFSAFSGISPLPLPAPPLRPALYPPYTSPAILFF